MDNKNKDLAAIAAWAMSSMPWESIHSHTHTTSRHMGRMVLEVVGVPHK